MEFTQQSVAECCALLDKLELVQNDLVDTLRSSPGTIDPVLREQLKSGVEALSPQIESTRELLERMRQRLTVTSVPTD